MKNNHYDVLIIGGGIIGHSISYYLNKSGVHAAVVEKQASGGKATRAAAGMLGVHTENEGVGEYHQFCEKSRDMYAGLDQELRKLTSIDIGLSHFGMLEIAVQDEEKEALLLKKSAFPNLEWLDTPRDRISSLSNKALGALFMKDDGHVEPRQVCEAFKRAALLCGGNLLEDRTVLGFENNQGSFMVKLDSRSLTAEHVVVASGAESGRWFETTGLQNPIVPTKGECFSIKLRENYFNEVLFFRDFYVVPKPDGRCIIGATSKLDDQTTDTSVGGLSDLMNRLFSFFPEWKDAALQDFWSGVRPGTKDGVPVIGEHPSISKLYFATGHYRNGILLAPATGQLIENLIAKKQVEPSIQELFSPSRLAEEGEVTYEYST
ncbi:glycine oxidase [Halobacillus andaensis]|uniref:glycine oxidase n=1 Tax=Halobacillus andaensis TaxID=1176239 RepID=A0A917B6F6_HALAA|nr:glycine oxidase ThiO [Halobacillus andaensis]MBP2006433.1 glycine oxidase [Halobacillus andaensis]GGF27360.1 glycine oxidase [Halobacillus andaensis]